MQTLAWRLRPVARPSGMRQIRASVTALLGYRRPTGEGAGRQSVKKSVSNVHHTVVPRLSSSEPHR